MHGRIVIMGGGLAGLSAAHELRRRGYTGRIQLIEALDAVGGVARSSFLPHTETSGRLPLPIEYSWRATGSDYATFHQVMSEIPLWTDWNRPGMDVHAEAEKASGMNTDDKAKKPTSTPKPCPTGRTVADRTQVYAKRVLMAGPRALQVVHDAVFLEYLAGPQLNAKEKLRLLDRALVALTASRVRIHTDYAAISLQSFLRLHPVQDQYLHSVVVRPVTPVLGPDCYRASASSILEYFEQGARQDQAFPMMVFDAPTSEACFNHWYMHLVHTLSVEISLSTRVDHIQVDPRTQWIQGVAVSQSPDPTGAKVGTWSSTKVREATWTPSASLTLATGGSRILVADAYINALPPHIASAVLPIGSGEQPNLRALSARGLAHLPGVQFFFDEPLDQAAFPAGAFLLHTAWLLTIEPQGSTWRLDNTNTAGNMCRPPSNKLLHTTHGKPWPHTDIARVYGDGTIEDVWSVTICDDDRRGLRTRKRWVDCTVDEVVEEVWHQLQHETIFSSSVRGTRTRKPMTELRFVYAHVWQTFVNPETGRMQHSVEPMVSSNADTLRFRPSTKSPHHPNMVWAGAHVKNRKEIVRMDAAIESGIMAAEYVMARPELQKWIDHRHRPPPRPFTKTWTADIAPGPPRLYPWLCCPFRALDHIVWRMGGRHGSDVCGGSGLLYVLFVVVAAVAFGLCIWQSL